jgi:hypothetical protein
MLALSKQNRRGGAFLHRGLLVAVVAAGAFFAALSAEGASLGTRAARAELVSFTVSVTITNSEVELAPSTVPIGSVVFKIINRATIARDFEIGGKKTGSIEAGKASILRAEITRPSRYVSVAFGHAPLSEVLGALPACTNARASTVDVQIADGTITLSRPAVPCGTVTFVVTNNATQHVHNFHIFLATDLNGGDFGPNLRPGETANMKVVFPYKGKVYYASGGVPTEAEEGLVGVLLVD